MFLARLAAVLVLVLVLAAASPVHAQGNLNPVCSVQAEWCPAVTASLQRKTGQRETGFRMAVTTHGLTKAVARAETGAAISLVHDAVTEKNAGFPVAWATSCEGTGEILAQVRAEAANDKGEER